tara:strand:- start:737 stop:1033 length:297 start_codon:yes stop_codon:yes gene_type:complete
MTDNADLIRKLEERSRLNPQRVVRISGFLDNEKLELIIFRGFSSSTTHPTEFDPDTSVIPSGTTLQWAELLQAPLNPIDEVILLGPISLLDLLFYPSW